MSHRKLLRGVGLALLAMALPWFAFAGEGADLPAAAAEPRQVEIGAFVAASPPTAAAINEFEALSGRHIRSAMWFQGWDASNQPPFPSAALTSGVRYHDGYDTHTILHLTWEPWVRLADIASGVYDAYLASYAGQARDWGEPVRLRFAHEMIQDNVYNNCQGQANCPEWYPWQDQPANYVLAFRHVHDVFAAEGATNVEFVWCPNNYPFQLSVVQPYYPGPGYVDWLCIDGYNSTNRDGQPGWPDWQWVDDLFYTSYHSFVDNPGVFGDKPVMIGEFASCEAGPYELAGQTKAAWISNAFTRLASSDYAKIGAFYWFNIDKECDWRIDSSLESLAAFQTAVRDDPPFISHPSLAVTKQASSSSVAGGAPLTYTLRVTNTGSVTLTAAITDSLPAHVSPGGSLTWQPAITAPGGVWTQQVVVTVETGYTGTLANAVHVTTDEGPSGTVSVTVCAYRCSVYLPIMLKK